MGNLSNREKGLIVVIVGLLILVLFIFFGFKPLYNNIQTQKVEYDKMKAREAQYDAIRDGNTAKEAAIEEANKSIVELENKFLPEINTENIVYYLMDKFESNGCCYLFDWSTEKVDCAEVTLPDGSTSSDRLVCERVTLSYSTTDGYSIPEYNRNPEWVEPGEGFNTTDINEAIAQMGYYGLLNSGCETNTTLPGYVEFLNTLKLIETEFPSAVKISNIKAEDTGFGYMHLIVSIDFYALDATSRVSIADTSAPYVSWSGPDSYDASAGIICQPIVVLNPGSDYWYVSIVDSEVVQGEREFASWYSYTILSDIVENNNMPLVYIDNGEYVAPASEYEFDSSLEAATSAEPEPSES